MKKIIFAIHMMVLCNAAWSQMDTSRHVMLLKDGTKIYGYVKEEHIDTLYFLSTLMGDLAIPRSKIKDYYKQTNIITPAKVAIYNDRYFLCESAYGVKANTGYIASSEIYVNKAAYGVTDLFSIEAGSTYNADLEGIQAYLGGKYSFIMNQNLRAAYRIMIGKEVNNDNSMQYRHEAILTFGSRTSNLSISYYYHRGAIGYEESIKRRHFFSLSSRYQFTRNLSFVFENIFVNKNILLANIGISKDFLQSNWSIGISTLGWLPTSKADTRLILPYMGVKIQMH
jgi:hypothetical protein